jgi:selenide, water dikinase
VLDTVLGKLARQHDPNVLVGFDKADDAGVYLIGPDQALVQTVDFFTPIVDDPYIFGQIAATNALSDVYAMGGRPLTALAMVCFPEKGDFDVLERILAGGLSKMMEAGCTIVGGHSIRDPEIKFGYSVTGMINPRRVLTNSGALPGDKLIFTKAIGTGVISTAIKRGKAQEKWIEAATRSMTTLNKVAAEVAGRIPPQRTREDAEAIPFRVHSMTDITGFGLIGHAREMALGSNVSLRGLMANREFAECVVSYEDSVPEDVRTILYDPQTAGGLLISIAAEDANELVRELNEASVGAALIGEVLESRKPVIEVVG